MLRKGDDIQIKAVEIIKELGLEEAAAKTCQRLPPVHGLPRLNYEECVAHEYTENWAGDRCPIGKYLDWIKRRHSLDGSIRIEGWTRERVHRFDWRGFPIPERRPQSVTVKLGLAPRREH